MSLRFTPSRLALSYIALGALALALFAIPLWYGYRSNLGTFRAYVPGAEMQRLVEIFHRDGPRAVATAVDSYLPRMPRDEVVIFVDPEKRRLAGSLPAWPAEVPDVPGTYGLVIGLGGDASMRVVTTHVTLPGGYVLLMGRESVRFDSLVARFWYGIAGAVAIVLTLGLAFAWLLRRERGQLETLVTQRTAAARLSEERYARAMEATEAGHWEWDLVANEVFHSARFRELYGISPEEKFASRDAWKARQPVSPAERERQERALQAAIADPAKRYDIELSFEPRPGEVRWLRSRGRVFRGEDGRALRVSGATTDITAQKLAQEALRRSEERYARVMQASEDGFWEWVVATDEFYASPRMLALYGLPPDTVFRSRKEFLSRFPFHPEDLELWQRAVAAHLAGETARVDIEVRAKLRGQTGWIHLTAICLRDASGAEERWTGSVSDVTERRRAQEALRVSEERYARAMDGSDAGHWDWNIVSDEMFVSERAREMLCLPGGSLPRTRTDMMALVPMHPDDRAAMSEAVKAGIKSGIHERDYRVIPRPGEVRWLRTRAKVYKDARGAAVRMTGSLIDITERRLAAEALRASEGRYSLAMEASEEGHFDVNLDTDEHFISERLIEIHGFPLGTRTAKRSEFIKHIHFYGDDAEKFHAAIAAAEAKDGPERYECEFRIVRPSGEVRWLRTRGKVTRDAEGRARRRTGVVADITERKLTEEALRLSEKRYALAMEVTEEGHFDWNVQTDEIFSSARALSVVGLPPDAKYRTRSDVVAGVRYHPDDWPRISAEWRAALAGRDAEHEFEYRILRGAAQEPRWIRGRWKIFRDAAGAALRVIGVVTDITERKLAAGELRESEARFRDLTELSSDWYWEQDENLRFTYLSGQAGALTGYSGESSLGKTRWEIVNMTPLSCSWAEHQAVLAARKPFRDLECRRVGPDGTVRYLSMSGAPIFDAQGRFRGYRGIGRSITERKRIEEALRQSEERYALAVEGSNEGIFDWDLVSDRVYVSYRAQELFGLPRGELWRPRRDWRHILSFHPDDAPRLHDTIKAHIEGGAPTYDVEFRIVAPGGGVRWYRQRGVALRDPSGKAYRLVGSIGDVTEKHVVEEELKAVERKLRLAQRLEAMGTLAGGIAHDFNNILGAILGYGEMARRDAPRGSRLARDLDSIVTAGERGRALVDRVLAFSRSGVGERVPVHVEKVVREALDLVSAKLPPEVTLHAKLHAGRAAMLGDPTQVHQVLMNLATNAVQAMPGGGTLRVSLDAQRVDAARAPTLGILDPGEYLVLQVADSGTGIAPEILERIFDPFFTTKEVGTGTGLGLSLVHGIVAEVGGAIDVASAPGKGSTFTVYLPRSGDADDSSQTEEFDLPRGDGQRVLVVDDEEPLVRLATRTLEELGYAPVGFTSSAAALAAFRADPQRFDALITDERMPGMSGSALIREVRGIRDRIPIVLMSGYTGGAIASRAREAGAKEVLKKPLSARDLAASLARVLHP